MKIGTKLASALFAAALLLAGGCYLTLARLESASLKSKGEDLANRAAMGMDRIEEDVRDRIEEMSLCAAAVNLPRTLVASNREFDEDPSAAEQIEAEDAAWSDGRDTARLDEILRSPVSRLLDRYAKRLEKDNGIPVFAELFVTNKYGVVVAATERTSDYLQADEPWYQAAIAETDSWVGDVCYDESARTNSFDLVIPIRDGGGELLGVVKGVLNCEYVGRTLGEIQARSIYKTAKACLVSDSGRALLVGQTKNSPETGASVEIGGFGADLSANPAVVAALASGQGYHTFSDGGVRKLAAFSRSTGSGIRKPLGWTLIVVYDVDEVLHEILTTEQLSLLGAFIVLSLAAIAGYLFARSIATPVTRLTAAAIEIAGGQDHSRVADRGRRDELGDLLRAFNRMADELTVFRKFTETSGHGFAMFDLQGRVSYANPALCRLAHCGENGEVADRNILSCYPEDVRQQLEKEIFPAVVRDRWWSGELPLAGHDGSRTPTLQYLFLIRDERGEPLRLANVITDITQLREAEAAWRENHQELEAIYDQVVDGILVVDVQTRRFVRANRAICRMTGYSEDELLSLSVDDIHPADCLPHVLEKFEAQAQSHISLAESIPVLRKDGSVFFADVANGVLIYGGRNCLVGLFRDITERREAQEALQREHATLRKLLETHDHERQLISYEIHDGLAQQLTAAIMQCQACRQPDASSESSTSRCCGTVRQILLDCLAEARRLISGVRPPLLDESGVVTAIRDLAQEAVCEEGPEIEFHSRVSFDRLEPVLENSLYRIAQESLANACRHSRSDRVRLELIERDAYVQIAVEDWGVGFDPDDVPDDRYGLTGIRERTRLLGGNVTIDSAPGKGTRIVVLLPLCGETMADGGVREINCKLWERRR